MAKEPSKSDLGELPEAELKERVWPSILELQKLLVDRTRLAMRPGEGRLGEEVAVVSVTSCESHSCY